MRSTHVLTGIALVGALALGSSAAAGMGPQAASASAQLSDDTIESRVEAVLKKDSMLAPRSIDVEADHGRVTLTGKVKTAEEKARAATVAKIAGVTAVVNSLEIDPNVTVSTADKAAAKTKEGLNKAVDATVKGAEKAKEGVGKAAEKTGEALGTAGEKLSDAAVTTKVKGNFAKDVVLKDADIAVDTSDHIVTLRGTVVSASAKMKAEEVAKGTDGVTRVVNEIVVRP